MVSLSNYRSVIPFSPLLFFLLCMKRALLDPLTLLSPLLPLFSPPFLYMRSILDMRVEKRGTMRPKNLKKMNVQ